MSKEGGIGAIRNFDGAEGWAEPTLRVTRGEGATRGMIRGADMRLSKIGNPVGLGSFGQLSCGGLLVGLLFGFPSLEGFPFGLGWCVVFGFVGIVEHEAAERFVGDDLGGKLEGRSAGSA